MERHEETFDVDTIRHKNSEWDTTLHKDEERVVSNPVYTNGYELEFNGPVTVEFDEYYTKITGDMKVTVSWVEREFEGEPYEEDHQIEDVEVFA